MRQKWFSLYTEEHFLGSGWKTESLPGLLSAALFAVVLSIVYECSNYTYHIFNLNTLVWHSKGKRLFAHGLLTGLRTFSTAASYVTMLCVMTYNVWILISVIFGVGVGHFVCRPFLFLTIQKQVQKYQEHTYTTDAISDGKTVTNDGIPLRNHVGSSEDEDRILRETRFSEILLDDNL